MLARRALGEFVGTAALLAAIVGSGISAERLSPAAPGLQLLENAVATAVVLAAVIVAIGPASGAHLNPVVTLADRAFGGLTSREAGAHLIAQLAGSGVGVLAANLMFSLPAVDLSSRHRSSGGLWLAETVATFGLMLVVLGVARSRWRTAAPWAVGAYIGGAVLFTSSTGFADPAVTVSRMLSDTFAGIAPASVAPFVVAQLLGAALAVAAVRALYPGAEQFAVVLPHPTDGAANHEVKA